MSQLTPSPAPLPPYTPSAEVVQLREELGEAGEVFFNVIKEEMGYIVPEVDGTFSVYTRRKGIKQVVAVNRRTDVNKTLNLYIGNGSRIAPEGRFNQSTGIITLAPNDNYKDLEPVIYSYVHQEGLTDDMLDTTFSYGRVFIQKHTGSLDIDFTNQSAGWWGAIKIARISCLLILSTGGVLQSGYNLGIEEFRLETKAWGEGMIAQFLWMQYQKEIQEILAMFGVNSRLIVASRPRLFSKDNKMEMFL
jgi:hypothetical protein